MTGRILRRIAAHQLARSGIGEADSEARYFTAEFLRCSFPELELGLRRLQKGEGRLFRPLLKRRMRREPSQYIFARAYFRDLELEVAPDVLIPRPETELLVDFLLRETPRNGRLLDLGTGSGAIAVACAVERPDLHVTAVDVSEKALAVARRNAARYGVNVEFILSDCCSALGGRSFDAVGANLPYVSEEEYLRTDQEVRDFEPKLALTAPDEGLALMKRAAAELQSRLAAGGRIIFEHGDTQSEKLLHLLREIGYTQLHALKDYCGKTRFAVACVEKM